MAFLVPTRHIVLPHAAADVATKCSPNLGLPVAQNKVRPTESLSVGKFRTELCELPCTWMRLQNIVASVLCLPGLCLQRGDARWHNWPMVKLEFVLQLLADEKVKREDRKAITF